MISRTAPEPPELPDAPLDSTTLSRDPEVGRIYAGDPLVWRASWRDVVNTSLWPCLLFLLPLQLLVEQSLLPLKSLILLSMEQIHQPNK